MLEFGTDPEAYITEYTLVYEDKQAEGVRHLVAFNDWNAIRIATVGIHPQKAWNKDPAASPLSHKKHHSPLGPP